MTPSMTNLRREGERILRLAIKHHKNYFRIVKTHLPKKKVAITPVRYKKDGSWIISPIQVRAFKERLKTYGIPIPRFGDVGFDQYKAFTDCDLRRIQGKPSTRGYDYKAYRRRRKRNPKQEKGIIDSSHLPIEEMDGFFSAFLKTSHPAPIPLDRAIAKQILDDEKVDIDQHIAHVSDYIRQVGETTFHQICQLFRPTSDEKRNVVFNLWVLLLCPEIELEQEEMFGPIRCMIKKKVVTIPQ